MEVLLEPGLQEAVLQVNEYAKEHTGCAKVHVGSAILELTESGYIVPIQMATNECLPNTCKTLGCNRIRLYGEDSKSHRLPSDCNAIHSEANLICKCGRKGISLVGATVLVSRYPCEGCARLLIKSKVGKVYYCRTTPPSQITIDMFKEAGIPLIRLDFLDNEDSNER